MENKRQNWHSKHNQNLTPGAKIADIFASFVGSWTFVVIQTIIIIVWITLNVLGYVLKWDAYPFVLLNLVFSLQAAYTAPIIMMAQNRQADRDRYQALEDFETNTRAEQEILKLQKELSRIENEKFDKIISLLEKK